MKKTILAFALILGIHSTVFSLEESWLSFGTGFGAYFAQDERLGDFYLRSFGVSIYQEKAKRGKPPKE